MALCHTILQPPRNVRRRASLPLTLILLLYLCLQTCVSVELPRDEQQRDDPESALSDLDSTAYTDNLAAIELEENTVLKPQTEWRSDISDEAAHAFSAAVAAQRVIKEVLLLCSSSSFHCTPSLTSLPGISFRFSRRSCLLFTFFRRIPRPPRSAARAWSCFQVRHLLLL